jgi:hypothetical protein
MTETIIGTFKSNEDRMWDMIPTAQIAMRSFFVLVSCLAWVGCRTVSKDAAGTESALPAPILNHAEATPDAREKRSRSAARERDRQFHICTCQKFNPVWWFGNIHDPEPPEWYRPGDKHRTRKWRWRNPGHNFTFYVIGIADKDFRRVGRYPDAVFNPNEGWNWAVCKYRCLRLPFLSFKKGRFHFYCGWRERGNFGFKCTCTRRAAKRGTHR